MRFRYRREAGFAAIGPTARIAAGLVAVALVVVFNQTSGPAPSVLGTKITRCEVGDASVPLGRQKLQSDRLTVTVANGKPGAVLLPAKRVDPRRLEPEVPATLRSGVRPAKKGTMAITVEIENASTCPLVASEGRVVIERVGSSTPAVANVRFGGDDRLVIEPGRRATARVVMPAAASGSWVVDASAYAEFVIAAVPA